MAVVEAPAPLSLLGFQEAQAELAVAALAHCQTPRLARSHKEAAEAERLTVVAEEEVPRQVELLLENTMQGAVALGLLSFDGSLKDLIWHILLN